MKKSPSLNAKALIIVACVVVVVVGVIIAQALGLRFEMKFDNYTTQKQELQAKCSVEAEEVDEIACLKLGKIFEREKDTDNAIKYYARACSANAYTHLNEPELKYACSALGALFEAQKEYSTALTYYALACEFQEPKACAKISELAPKEPEFRAANAFFKACRENFRKKEYYPACLELQKIYVKNDRDIPSAIKEMAGMCWDIFLPACAERNKAVDKYVADRIKNARLEVDKREYIISNFDKYCANFKAKSACEAKESFLAQFDKECQTDEANGESCVLLASFYMSNKTKNLYNDKFYLEPFKKTAQKGCDLGNSNACYLLAKYYYKYLDLINVRENKTDELAISEARKFGKRVCAELKDAGKCVQLAEFETDIKENDDERVKNMFFYLKTGCDELGDVKVCQTLAEHYDKGVVNKHKPYHLDEKFINQKQALHYYDKACALGEGCMRLAQIYLWGEYVSDKEVRRNLAKAKHYFARDCDSGVDDYECGIDGDDNVCSASNPSCLIKRLSPKELENLDESIFN